MIRSRARGDDGGGDGYCQVSKVVKWQMLHANLLVMVMTLGTLSASSRWSKSSRVIVVALAVIVVLPSLSLGHLSVSTNLSTIPILSLRTRRIQPRGRCHWARWSHGPNTTSNTSKHSTKLALNAWFCCWPWLLRLRSLYCLRNWRHTSLAVCLLHG